MSKKYLMLIILALTLILSSILGYYNTLGLPKRIKEKELVTMTLHVQLNVPEKARHLIFLIRVRNLTAQGIKPILEARIQPLMKPDGVRFSFKAWKIFRGYIEVREKGKLIKIPVFYLQNIWVYAIAYDPETKTLYYGSWTKSLDPYHNQTTDVIIKVKACHSTEVTADKVPEPGQQSPPKRVKYCTQAVILAISIPAGAYYDYAIKRDTKVPIESFERLYWTDDSNPRDPNTIWYDEGWESSGAVSIILDYGLGVIGDGVYVPGPASLFYYPVNVNFTMATDGEIWEIPGEVSWVIVKKYAVDTKDNGVKSSYWDSPDYRSNNIVGDVTRPDPGPIVVPAQDVYVPQSISISFTFTAVTGTETAYVEFQAGVTFTFKRITVVEARIYVDWDNAPANATEFEVDRYDDDGSVLKGWFIGG